jgi:hypothetical protein
MAELVDALVSNTNAARRAGSTPALGTKARCKAGFFVLIHLYLKVELASNTNTARHSGLHTGGMFDPAFAGRQVRLWVQKLAEKRAFFV